MVYYRVKKEYDNYPRNPKIRNGEILIGYELYTEEELKKLPLAPVGAFERVLIPKEKTHFCFGVRFENCQRMKKYPTKSWVCVFGWVIIQPKFCRFLLCFWLGNFQTSWKSFGWVKFYLTIFGWVIYPLTIIVVVITTYV